MKIAKGILAGSIFGLLLSTIISWMFMLFAQGLAGGFTSLLGESWLYYATAIPFVLTFSYLGAYFTKQINISNKKLWIVSLIVSFLILLFSGTVGAIFGETIVRGDMKTININGTLIWGTIYAVLILPLATPISRLMIHMFLNLQNKWL